jgi:hypothetical protein
MIKMVEKGNFISSICMLLDKRKPMTNYEDFKTLYDFLKLKNNPKKHLTNMTSWEIIEHP